jgi:hypothetical protein
LLWNIAATHRAEGGGRTVKWEGGGTRIVTALPPFSPWRDAVQRENFMPSQGALDYCATFRTFSSARM